METDKNPFPNIELFPQLARVGRFLGRLVSFFPSEAPDFMSNHNRGGGPMLDRELFDKPAQLELDYGRDE